MNRASWLQKRDTSIQVRTGVCLVLITIKILPLSYSQVSDKWHPVFEEYKKIEIHPYHLTLVGSSILPHLRITRSGQALILERRAFPNDTDVPVSRRYQFSSKAEAISWYEIWKHHLQNHLRVTG